MKLNKYIGSLLVASALTFVGCSDYQDTEIISPQANENALGANFTAAATSIVAHPDDTSFKLTLNRVNTKSALTVPVTVVSCEEVSTGVKFCDQPTAFVFAAGEAKATVTLKFNAACKFQKTYKMALTIGKEKDHPYAAGTSATTVSFIKDYTWKTLDQPVALENEGWLGKDAGILVPVEYATNYKDANDSKKKLFRLKAVYAYAGLTGSTNTGHIQFFLDENYAPAGLFSINGYDPTNIDTGVATKVEKEFYRMNVTNITGGIYEKDEEENIKLIPYTFTYNLFSNPVDDKNKDNVTLKLDFDIKAEFKK